MTILLIEVKKFLMKVISIFLTYTELTIFKITIKRIGRQFLSTVYSIVTFILILLYIFCIRATNDNTYVKLDKLEISW